MTGSDEADHNPPLRRSARLALAEFIPASVFFSYWRKAAGRPIVCLSSPPGPGKTTVVAHYLMTRHSRPLWYQIDAVCHLLLLFGPGGAGAVEDEKKGVELRV